MRKVWWTWDIRMRWAPDFCYTPESFFDNYKAAIDVASCYGVEGIVIWGFLRDSHGGIETAKKLCDYAITKNVMILPGVGIDGYGGVYYDGNSPYSLNTYLTLHPEAQAQKEDGTPLTFRWPPQDRTERKIGCPSFEGLMKFYNESLCWLIDTFKLKGFQIEQGDNGVCMCQHCRVKTRTMVYPGSKSVLENQCNRMGPVIQFALERYPHLTVIAENYHGLTLKEVKIVGPYMQRLPSKTYISWQVYSCPALPDIPEFFFGITEESKSPTLHGSIAIRTNNDLRGGERDDRVNIRKAIILAKKAGLDMTYLYGEYPDSWPITRANYEAWAEIAK